MINTLPILIPFLSGLIAKNFIRSNCDFTDPTLNTVIPILLAFLGLSWYISRNTISKNSIKKLPLTLIIDLMFITNITLFLMWIDYIVCKKDFESAKSVSYLLIGLSLCIMFMSNNLVRMIMTTQLVYLFMYLKYL